MTAKKITVVIILVTLTAGIYLLIKSTPELAQLFRLNKPNSSTQFKPSVFGKLKTDENPNKGRISPELEQKYQNDPEGLAVFRYGWGLDNPEAYPPDIVWDYKLMPIEAVVTNYSSGTDFLTMRVLFPETHPLFDIEKELPLPTDCRVGENTFVYDQAANKSFADKDFKSELKQGDLIVTFCLNEQCDTIGKLCKIARFEGRSY